jgi:crotonobetainyl-CoA:carnitine CoA-transferase CaiB-like acyl-CoA transferase
MAITGEPDAPPTKIGVALVDVLTGLNAAVAILAALRRRDLGGTGERIEISLLDSTLAALVNVAQNALVMGEEPPRYGNAHASIVPYQPFAASDGWIAVAAANDGLFARLCEALARPELATDERFATNAARVLHRDALLPLLDETFVTRPADDWVATLEAAGVPVGKIRGVLEALRTAAPATVRVNHPAAGELSSSRRLSPSSRRRRPPLPRPRCWASTRARCSPSWGSTTRDSRRSRRPAWWRRPRHRIVAWSRSRPRRQWPCG